jgi:hypothetical protein
MSGNLPTWISYTQALVVPFVAIVGAVIAFGQLWLARRRMQLDLYDRRYRIFESARQLIVDFMQEGRVDWIYKYLRDTGDAVFLLDSSVVSYLGELKDRALRLRSSAKALANANDHHPHRELFIDQEADLQSWFSEQYDVLVEKFKPSLQLKSRWL